MATKNLIIVESPAKVKTIKKYLGSSYSVDASQGHVRDLPKSRFGIDVENNYEPEYITIRGKGELLTKLRKEAKAADKIYLATDPDREGEAISWHLLNSLKLDPKKKVYRISFNEITKNAIRESLKNPREIDMNLVDAQQARRVLDRAVGYRISPLLWSKIKRGLSAGRVQSVALRMICDREDEIAAFVPREYWTIEALLGCKGLKNPVKASFHGLGDEKMDISDKAQSDKLIKELKKEKYTVDSVQTSKRYRKSPLPFTTSTLQQEAGKFLNFSTQKTMSLAQQLYEGVSIPGQGNVALITYLRTDSTRISADADTACRAYIGRVYGDKFITDSAVQAKTGNNIQDAHEAIRPTDVELNPLAVKECLSRDLFRLYQLIWKRFVASRMKAAVYETESIRISAGKYMFTISGSRLAFEGFLNVYNDSEEKESGNTIIGKLSEGDVLTLQDINGTQHFTQPQPHYTEASLVKALEEQGIGRPSTYAPTITTIIARRYITREQKNLYVTELGQVVNDIMKKEFPDIVDKGFTANMETQLDQVAEGKLDWKKIIAGFYPDFDKAVLKAEKELESVTIADEETDVICDKCGRNMVIKFGPHGKFLACPGFPECKNTKPFLEKIGVRCPKCGADIVLKKTKKGRIFYGCERNPECDYASWSKPKDSKDVKPDED